MNPLRFIFILFCALVGGGLFYTAVTLLSWQGSTLDPIFVSMVGAVFGMFIGWAVSK